MVTWFLRLVGVAVAAVAALAPVARAEFIQVDPQGAFLRVNPTAVDQKEYDVHAPLIVDLAARGYGAGDWLHLRVVGTYALSMFPDSDPASSIDKFDFLGGVFSSTDELGVLGVLNRVAGAIDTSLPELVSMPTLYPLNAGLPTDIPEDFQIFNTLVQIPVGARFLFVAAPDIFYSDNRDPFPGGPSALADFGVEITIPEPDTLALIAMFAAALVGRRRQQARSAR